MSENLSVDPPAESVQLLGDLLRRVEELQAENFAMRDRIGRLEIAPTSSSARLGMPTLTVERGPGHALGVAPSRRGMLAAAAASAVIASGGWNMHSEAGSAELYVLRDEGVIPGTDVSVWQATSSSGVLGRFTFSDSITFSSGGQTFTDPVLYLGWNVGAGSTQPDQTRGSVWMDFEHDYWTVEGSANGLPHHKSEIHMVHAPPAATGGKMRRVFNSAAGWDTNLTAVSLHADQFDIFEGGEGNIHGTPHRQVFGYETNGPVRVRTRGRTGTQPVFEVVDADDNVVFAIRADGSCSRGIKMLDSPVRVYDSRAGFHPIGVAKGTFRDETRAVNLRLGAGIPSNVTGVFANFAVADTSPGGYGTLWRNGTPWPGTSSINWSGSGGTTTSNLAPTAIDVDGRASCRIAGTADVVIDIVGYVN